MWPERRNLSKLRRTSVLFSILSHSLFLPLLTSSFSFFFCCFCLGVEVHLALLMALLRDHSWQCLGDQMQSQGSIPAELCTRYLFSLCLSLQSHLCLVSVFVFSLCLFPAKLNVTLYWFPIADITNYCKLRDLKHTVGPIWSPQQYWGPSGSLVTFRANDHPLWPVDKESKTTGLENPRL